MSNPFSPIVSTRGERSATREKLVFRRYQARRFVFTIRTSDYQSKILQIFFNQRDGTLNVGFPYIPRMQGIATIGTLSPSLGKQEVSLETDGKVTSRRVKYAHKPDGRVHFSQDAQVKTEIKKDSIPLADQDGHVFTAYLQGVGAFEQTRSEQDDAPPRESRTVLNFQFSGEAPEAYKIVAMWHEVRGFLERSMGSEFGPTVNVGTPQGERARGFLIGTVIGRPLQDYALLVTCRAQSYFVQPSQPALLFIGGFDPAPSLLDSHRKDRFLCLKYPVSDYEELEQRLGSIDFDKGESDLL